MRKVEIVEDPSAQRNWIAVEVKSGERMLRLHDRGLLERVCKASNGKSSKGAPSALAPMGERHRRCARPLCVP